MDTSLPTVQHRRIIASSTLIAKTNESPILAHSSLSSSPSITSPVEGKVCTVCTTHFARYCCPKCFESYCSSSCFQNHNQECTELFAKEKIKEILTLEQKHAQEGADEVEELTHKFAEMTSNKTKLMRSSRVQLNVPWWEDNNENMIIGSLSRKGIYARLINSLLQSSAALSVSSRSIASEAALYQIFGILLGYVMSIRSFDFPWIISPQDVVEVLYQSTPAFQSSFRPMSVASGVEAWISARPITATTLTRKHMKSILNDVAAILADKELTIFAILECWLIAVCARQPYQSGVEFSENHRSSTLVVNYHAIDAFCCFDALKELDAARAKDVRDGDVDEDSEEGDDSMNADIQSKWNRETISVDVLAAMNAVAAVNSMLVEYQSIFQTPVQSSWRSKSGKHIRMTEDVARKSFYFLLGALGRGASTHIQALHSAVVAYVKECLAE